MNPLKSKSNEVLVKDLKELVSKERELLTDILRYLKEIEERKYYLEMGYPSLFTFAMEELGYSEDAAHRRIQAMRLIRSVPQIEEKLNSGEISLTVASKVQGYFRNEEKNKTIPKSEKLDFLKQFEGLSTRDCERKLAIIAPETSFPREIARVITEEKTLLQFTADQELIAGIEKLKALLFHQNPEGRLDKLFQKLVDLGLEKYDPERRIARREKSPCAPKVKPKPQQLEIMKKGEKDPPKSFSLFLSRSRYIPAKTRDEVWQRDKGRCQYERDDGHICGSTYQIQVDHIIPYAIGGNHDPRNLRLLCARHNGLMASKAFGSRVPLRIELP